MATEQSQDAAPEQAAEKPGEKATESAPLNVDEVTSTYKDRVDALSADQKQRVLDYIENKVRDTSSYQFLKDLRVSIVDDKGVSITRKAAAPGEPGGSGAAVKLEAAGTPVEAKVASDDAGREVQGALGGDWIDNLFDEALASVGSESGKAEPPESRLAPGDASGDGEADAGQAGEPADRSVEQQEPAALGSVEVAFAAAHVEKEGERVKKVVYPDGSAAEVDYDKQGPKTITHSPSGDKFERQTDGSWKQLSRDESGAYKEVPPEPGKDIKDINVTPEGDFIVTQGDGSKVRENHDGSHVDTQHINGKDCPTFIKHPNGQTTEIEYDAEGRATKVSSSQAPGETWERQPDGSWKHFKDGTEVELKEGEQPVADIIVSPDGELTAVNADGSSVTQHTDGSVVEKKLIQGEDGVLSEHVTRVTHPNGERQEIEYDEKGNPIKWSSTDPPETMVKQPDGKWLYTRKNGTTETFDSDVTVNDNGDISHRFKDGSFEEVYKRDGTVTEINRGDDGKINEVHFDAEGNVTEIKHPNGKSSRIEYDKNDPPNPTRITRPDGTEWRKEGSSWHEYEDGKPTGDISRGDITVRDDGVIVKKDVFGHELEKWRPDGKITDLVEPVRTRDEETGEITEETYPGNAFEKETTYKYKDGKLVEANAADGKTWKKTADGKWQQFDGGNPVGKPQDIDLKVSRTGDLIATKGGEPSFVTYRDGSRTDYLGDGSRLTTDHTGRTIEKVHPDGSYTTFNPDNTTLTRNADHQVIEATDGTGKVIRKIEYDAEGNPTKIVENGQVLEKQADGSWTGPDTEGSHIEVTREGGISRVGAEQTWTRNLDNSITRTYADGTSTTERERDGRIEVTQVVDKEGNTRDIAYDQNGKAISVVQTSPDGEKTLLLGKNDQGTLMVRRPGTDQWVVAKEVYTDLDGKVTVTTDSGEIEIPGREGGNNSGGESKVERTNINGEDLVTRVTYPDGRHREFSYDQNGELTEVRRSSGTVYNQEADGTWTSTDADGTKTKLQDVEVDKNGNLTWKEGLLHFRENADGTGERVDLEERSTVKYDSQDRPVEITNDKGTRKVEYGEDGQPRSITDVDGKTTWVREGEDRWTRIGPDGRPTSDPPETYNGKAEVEPDGDVVWRQTGTDRVTREYTDGSLSIKQSDTREKWNADGKLIETRKYDDKDRVVAVENARGKRTIEYGPDDRVTKITEPDGSSWERDGDTWKEYRDGEATGKTAQIEVGQNGWVERKVAGSSETVTEYTDGSRLVEKDDGSSMEYNASNKISLVTYPDGRQRSFLYSADGDLTEVRKSSGTTYQRGDNGTWVRTSADGQKSEVRDVELEENGDLSWTRGSNRWRENADGTEEWIDTDMETAVKYDSSERPVEISNRRVVRKIEYGEDGQPQRITDTDGKTTWVNEGGDKWRRYDENNNPVEPEETYQGTAEVGDGDITWRQAGTDRVTTEHADGSKTVSESGETKKYDADGNLIKTVREKAGATR